MFNKINKELLKFDSIEKELVTLNTTKAPLLDLRNFKREVAKQYQTVEMMENFNRE